MDEAVQGLGLSVVAQVEDVQRVPFRRWGRQLGGAFQQDAVAHRHHVAHAPFPQGAGKALGDRDHEVRAVLHVLHGQVDERLRAPAHQGRVLRQVGPGITHLHDQRNALETSHHECRGEEGKRGSGHHHHVLAPREAAPHGGRRRADQLVQELARAVVPQEQVGHPVDALPQEPRLTPPRAPARFRRVVRAGPVVGHGTHHGHGPPPVTEVAQQGVPAPLRRGVLGPVGAGHEEHPQRGELRRGAGRLSGLVRSGGGRRGRGRVHGPLAWGSRGGRGSRVGDDHGPEGARARRAREGGRAGKHPHPARGITGPTAPRTWRTGPGCRPRWPCRSPSWRPRPR